MHSTTGDLMRSLETPRDFQMADLMVMSREGMFVTKYDHANLTVYSLNGKLLRSATCPENIEVIIAIERII